MNSRLLRHERRAGLTAALGAAGVLAVAAALCPAEADAQDGAAELSVQERAVAVGGVTFHVRTAGAGPPLLLLHGFTGAGRWWDPLLHDLAVRHTVIVPDLPLHGRSTGRADWRYAEVAADVLALMDTLGIGTFRAVGYSAGGEVLLHMAARQPQRFDAVVLVSAVHRLTEQSRESLRTWPPFDEWEQPIRDYWLDVHPGGAAQVQVLIETLRAVADQDDAMNLTGDDLARMVAPTLIVIGDRDGYAPVEIGLELLRGLPNAGLWVVPGQGHFPLFADWGGSPEAQRTFADVVHRFFEAELR